MKKLINSVADDLFERLEILRALQVRLENLANKNQKSNDDLKEIQRISNESIILFNKIKNDVQIIKDQNN